MGEIIIKSQRVVDAEKRLKDLDDEFGYEHLSLSIKHKRLIASVHADDVLSKRKMFNTGVVVNDEVLHWRYCEKLYMEFNPGKWLIVD
jgi:hypothetical protein